MFKFFKSYFNYRKQQKIVWTHKFGWPWSTNYKIRDDCPYKNKIKWLVFKEMHRPGYILKTIKIIYKEIYGTVKK